MKSCGCTPFVGPSLEVDRHGFHMNVGRACAEATGHVLLSIVKLTLNALSEHTFRLPPSSVLRVSTWNVCMQQARAESCYHQRRAQFRTQRSVGAEILPVLDVSSFSPCTRA